MAAVAWLAHYPGTISWGRAYGRKYYRNNETRYISLRLTPSVVSSFCPVLVYCAMKNLAFSVPSAVAASFLVLFDFTQIVVARFILSDRLLHFSTCLHIFAFTLFLRNTTPLRTIFTGTTLSQIIWIFKSRPSFEKIVVRAASLIVPCALVFVTSWVVHFVMRAENEKSSPRSVKVS